MTKAEQLVVDTLVEITTRYLEDDRTTSESCAALGIHTRAVLDDLGLSEVFAEAITDRVLDDLRVSLKGAISEEG